MLGGDKTNTLQKFRPKPKTIIYYHLKLVKMKFASFIMNVLIHFGLKKSIYRMYIAFLLILLSV